MLVHDPTSPLSPGDALVTAVAGISGQSTVAPAVLTAGRYCICSHPSSVTCPGPGPGSKRRVIVSSVPLANATRHVSRVLATLNTSSSSFTRDLARTAIAARYHHLPPT